MRNRPSTISSLVIVLTSLLPLQAQAQETRLGAVNPDRVYCAKNARVVSVVQGQIDTNDARNVGITVVTREGNYLSYDTKGASNVGDNPEARTLEAMAMAALASQMPVNVIVAAKDCSHPDKQTFVSRWIGLEINAYQ